jgi:hypothetical protein
MGGRGPSSYRLPEMPLESPLELAPGLYAAALALVLAGLLRRWYDPVPARVGAAFALVLVLLFGSSLFGGRVLLPLDNLRGEVPFRQLPPTQPHGNLLQGDLIELVVPSLAAARRSLAAGRWPLWSSLAGAGMPLLADPQSQALSPLAMLALPFSPVRGAAVAACMRVYVALVFTFLLLRRQGLGEGPSLAGALAFGLSGFLLLWVGWPLASAAALLPAVLYALARLAASPDGSVPHPSPAAATPPAAGCSVPGSPAGDDLSGGRGGRRDWRRDGLLLGLALAALLLAGHPETELYSGLLAAAFAASLVWRSAPGRRLALVRRIGGAALVAAGLAAPVLLPALDYLPQTLRAQRLAHPAPQTPPLPGAGGGDLARRWLPVVAPNAYGNSRFAAYWGLSNTNEDASGFAGSAAALGAALAVAVPRRRRLPQEGLMLAVLGVSLLQLADPGWLHALLAARAPALAGSRRCLLPVAFCLAYLAACTFERRRRGELRRSTLLVAALALGALIAWAYLAHACPGDPERLAVLRFGWLRWQARFLAGATLLLALPSAWVSLGGLRGGQDQGAGGDGGGRGRGASRWRSLGAAAAAAGLAILVGAELLLAHLPANPPMPASLAFPVTPPLARIAGDLEGYRVTALGRALPPNLASMYGMNDARVYNPMAPAAYLALLAPITAAWWGELPELGNPGHPLYRQLAVRYLLVAPGERLRRPWRLQLADPSGWVYRRSDVWPRLYTTARGSGGEPLPDTVRLARFDDERVAARARIAGPGEMLAASLYQDGGWRLLVGGRRAPSPPAGRLLAAPMPGGVAGAAGEALAARTAGTAGPTGTAGTAGMGEVRLDLLYRPRGFIVGMLAAALAAAAAITLWSPRPDPARPPAAH